MQDIALAKQRLDEEDDKLTASASLMQMQLASAQELQRRKESGQYEGLVDDALKFVDDQRERHNESFKTPRGRQFFVTHANDLRRQAGLHAIAIEGNARVDARADQFEVDIDKGARAVFIDPSRYESVREQLAGLIGNANLPQEKKSSLLKSLDRATAMMAGLRQVELDPQGMLEKLTGVPRRAAAPVIDPASGEPQPIVEANVPRGIRNNNPGNLRRGPSKWEGEAEGADPSYTSFATPEHGLRAMAVTLQTYEAKHGLDTVAGIISRWAPASENNTAAYVAVVAKKLGVKPDERIDMHQASTLRKLMRAMIQHENGTDPYSAAQLDRAIRAADGRERLAEPTKGTTVVPYVGGDFLPRQDGRTGDPALDRLRWQDHLELVQSAMRKIQRDQADDRAAIHAHEGDAAAMALDGLRVPRPLTEAQFVRAYGQRDGAERFANYARTQDLAVDISEVNMMTPAARTAMLERRAPSLTAAQPGYAQERRRWETRARAVEHARKVELDDPMQAAIDRRLGGAQALDFSSLDTLGAGLRSRTGTATMMATQYETPYAVLTKREAAQLSAFVANVPTASKTAALLAVRDALRSDHVAFRAAIAQIAPDSPVTAAAAVIADKQRPLVIPHWFRADEVMKQGDVAGVMLEGESLLNKTKAQKADDGRSKGFPMPPDAEIRKAFADYVGKAFAGNPMSADFAFQGVRAHYAGTAAREGDVSGKLDGNRLSRSIRATTGGVVDFNGRGEVLTPWGMSDAQFKNEVRRVFSDAMTAQGWNGSVFDSLHAYGLESSGDSRYLLRTGSGYLVGKDGKPIELDLSARLLFDRIPR